MRNTKEPHKRTTTPEHQIPDLGQVQTFAANLILIGIFIELKY